MSDEENIDHPDLPAEWGMINGKDPFAPVPCPYCARLSAEMDAVCRVLSASHFEGNGKATAEMVQAIIAGNIKDRERILRFIRISDGEIRDKAGLPGAECSLLNAIDGCEEAEGLKTELGLAKAENADLRRQLEQANKRALEAEAVAARLSDIVRGFMSDATGATYLAALNADESLATTPGDALMADRLKVAEEAYKSASDACLINHALNRAYNIEHLWGRYKRRLTGQEGGAL